LNQGKEREAQLIEFCLQISSFVLFNVGGASTEEAFQQIRAFCKAAKLVANRPKLVMVLRDCQLGEEEAERLFEECLYG